MRFLGYVFRLAFGFHFLNLQACDTVQKIGFKASQLSGVFQSGLG